MPRVTVTEETREVQTSVPRAARFAVAVAFVCLGVGGGSWATRIPAVQHRLGLSAAELGVALFGLGFGSLVSMPLTGVVVARRGSRPVMRATAPRVRGRRRASAARLEPAHAVAWRSPSSVPRRARSTSP